MSSVEFPIYGALVSWNPGDSLYDRVVAAMALAGFAELAPKPKTDYEALKEALGEIKGKDQIVQRHRAHEKHGCELVDVTRGEEENQYERKFGARVVNGQIQIDQSWRVDREAVQRRYEEAKATVSGREMSIALVDVIKSLSGVRLREKGSLYWLPEESLSRWCALADELEAAGKTEILILRTELNPRAVKHIADSLSRDVLKACEEICEEVSTMGDAEAIERRKTRAMELRGLVNKYADILGQGLDGLKRAIQLAETAAMMASMQALAGAA
jgi:hypothetical protein